MPAPLIALLFVLGACTPGASSDAPPTREASAPSQTPAQPGAPEVVAARIESEEATFRVVRVVGGLEHPWALAFLPDGRMLVTERPGRLVLVEGGAATQVSGVPEVAARGQGGLLDVVLHPDYAANGWIYLTYAVSGQGGLGTRLARARLQGSALGDIEVLYTLPRLSGAGQHFGSRLAFMQDGTLLMTVGDRGDMPRAQDPADAAGSTLRFNADGSIPADNPFVGRDGVRPEVYTYGNRNSQGMDVHPETGAVWQTEHGPRGGDEINVIRAGRNYGWPAVSYGADYRTRRPIGQGQRAPGVEDPVLVWTPSIGPSGTAFYFGEAFPAWRGNLFVGALAHRTLVRVVLDGETVTHQERLIDGTIGRIRDVRQGPDGFVYVLTDERDGGVYRLEPVR